jgi:hypothetical protein
VPVTTAGVKTLVNPVFSGPPVYPIREPDWAEFVTLNTTVSPDISRNLKLIEPPPGTLELPTVVKGPTLGDSPAIVMFGKLVVPVLLSSTKLPLSVHVVEQVADVPLRAAKVAATSSVMMAAFAAPTWRAMAHETATSAALIFHFMQSPLSTNCRSYHEHRSYRTTVNRFFGLNHVIDP